MTRFGTWKSDFSTPLHALQKELNKLLEEYWTSHPLRTRRTERVRLLTPRAGRLRLISTRLWIRLRCSWTFLERRRKASSFRQPVASSLCEDARSPINPCLKPNGHSINKSASLGLSFDKLAYRAIST